MSDENKKKRLIELLEDRDNRDRLYISGSTSSPINPVPIGGIRILNYFYPSYEEAVLNNCPTRANAYYGRHVVKLEDPFGGFNSVCYAPVIYFMIDEKQVEDYWGEKDRQKENVIDDQCDGGCDVDYED